MPISGRVRARDRGGRGIGRAIALGIGGMGARVAVLARSPNEVAATVVAASQRGNAALALPADVNVPEQVRGALSVVANIWSPVEIMENNAAAVWSLGLGADINLEDCEAALAHQRHCRRPGLASRCCAPYSTLGWVES